MKGQVGGREGERRRRREERIRIILVYRIDITPLSSISSLLFSSHNPSKQYLFSPLFSSSLCQFDS